ncbi:site-specific integrase [Flavobacterium sp. J49]|uniref:site-specific integrase n=1 Tax=Flavobacterium sp. J49 TaxID=2718534 RepID=UPI0015931E87|nr:site-specific integrase [Flavobacterium sp. J49]MBF6641668.1 site-specific integrase [Flavobacterium sp. J49]NIC02915.1 site-specific integrase [Flavobacterium sp. J49]
MATSVKLLLKNKPRSDFTYPIVLQVIKDGKAKVIYTGISCNKSDWTGQELKKTHPNFQKRNLILMNIKQRALKIIDDFIEEGIDFTLNEFEKLFKGDKQNSRITVFEHFQDVIQRMKLSNRLGNSKSYLDTCNSFFKFHSDRDLTFKGLNVTLLEKYEAYLRNRNNQDSGIAFKMRALRALFNSAIRNGIVSNDHYPFDKYKISKLKGKGIKRALTRDEVKRIIEVDLSDRPDLINTKNYFVFSYFVRGINWIDVLKLKKENIQDDYIVYIRSKTKTVFKVKILPPVKKILDYYLNQNRATEYVFPILLRDDLTPMQIENRKQKTLKRFNKELKELAKVAKVAKNVTSYVIRHSYATNLKQLGVSVEKISQSMGHSSVEITNSYLKDFETEEIDFENEKLLNFNL